jgi:alpha-beta hydrolase superfamily lysophospholipase
MRPLFFGDGHRQLFGAYHAVPETSEQRDAAVVLAYPSVFEYNMSHWALRKLAAILARAGFPTLRFDYYGTGDSAGETGSGLPSDWVGDIHAAADEVRDLSGARRLMIVGLGLGASLGVLAVESGLEVEQLVLWDPVVNGRDYIRALERLDERQRLHRLYPRGPWTFVPKRELLGFPFPAALRKALEGVDLQRVRLRPKQRVSVVASTEQPAYRALATNMEARQLSVTLQVVSETNSDPNAAEGEAALLSSRPLHAITEALMLGHRNE